MGPAGGAPDGGSAGGGETFADLPGRSSTNRSPERSSTVGLFLLKGQSDAGEGRTFYQDRARRPPFGIRDDPYRPVFGGRHPGETGSLSFLK